ncbi:MAG TPA: response regulator [Candidatus Krumholzibacteria bacterium]|nr:response regulator [Candidatus Krumholzibacteria bacterium]HRX49938.1 response regulator [Candidatus Krumholzibacteria bacterium]
MAWNILLVDDSITVRAVVQKALQIAEIPYRTIYQAGNGREALEVLEAQEVDLVITDLVMPEMDGEALVTEMGRRGWLLRTPVVVVSSASGEDRLKRLEELGVKGFIHKPFTPEQIRQTVSLVMEVTSR